MNAPRSVDRCHEDSAANPVPRLDEFIAHKFNLSKTRSHKLIRARKVLVNGKVVAKAGYAVKRNDEIEISDLNTDDDDGHPKSEEVAPEHWETATLLSEALPLDVIFEDADLIVLNKQKGMAVHPSAHERSGTLVNALIARVGLENLSPNQKEPFRPGIVHRLDKETSGLIVVTKRAQAADSLSAQFAQHSASRIYWCLVHHPFRESSGTIDVPLVRHPNDGRLRTGARENQKVDESNRAVTHWKVLQRFGEDFTDSLCLIECSLETGKTHQIRAHMKHIQHPILNDFDYGAMKEAQLKKRRDRFVIAAIEVLQKYHIEGQVLHARHLEFNHPTTKERVCFKANLPLYFQEILDKLRALTREIAEEN